MEAIQRFAELPHVAQAGGGSQSLFQATSGGHDAVIDLGNHDSLALIKLDIAALHASNFIIH